MLTDETARRWERIVLPDKTDRVCVSSVMHKCYVARNIDMRRTQGYAWYRLFAVAHAAVMQDMGLVIFPAADEASVHHICCFISDRAVRGIFDGNCKLLHLF